MTEVDLRMADIQASLPPDIRAKTVIDRSRLVDAPIQTVRSEAADER